MRLCAFADESDARIEGQIDALHRNGIGLTELRQINEKNVSELTSSEIRQLRSLLDSEGISVWSIGSPIGKIAIDGDLFAELEVFKRLCEHTLMLGCHHMRIFSFFISPEAPQPTDAVMEGMYRYCKYAPSELILCHENEKGIYGDTDERCLELLREFSRLKAVFDPANFVQCGVDTLKAWEKLSPFVEYLHVKDALHSGVVVQAGQGDGNVKEIVSKYLQSGGDVITAEPHLQHFSGLANLERGQQTLIQSSDLSMSAAFDLGVNATKNIIREVLQ